MTQYIYKCLEEKCKDTTTYRYRGLCRSCTEYKGGEPVVPILRVKHNDNGTLFLAQSSTNMDSKAITRREMQSRAQSESAYRKHQTQMRKMRQARRDNPEAFVEPNEHIHDENCGHDIDMSQIGESVGEEE